MIDATQRIRGIADSLLGKVRGCRQHEPDQVAFTDVLLDGWAHMLECIAAELDEESPAECVARLQKETRDANALAESARHAAAKAEGDYREMRQLADRQREQLIAARAEMQRLHDANLSRPDIKPLADAIQVLLLVMVSIPYKADEADKHRQMLCGAEDIAQAALRSAGACGKFPAARLAGEMALRRYAESCSQQGGDTR